MFWQLQMPVAPVSAAMVVAVALAVAVVMVVAAALAVAVVLAIMMVLDGLMVNAFIKRVVRYVAIQEMNAARGNAMVLDGLTVNANGISVVKYVAIPEVVALKVDADIGARALVRFAARERFVVEASVTILRHIIAVKASQTAFHKLGGRQRFAKYLKASS